MKVNIIHIMRIYKRERSRPRQRNLGNSAEKISVNRPAWTCAKRLPARFFQTFSPVRFETCCPERQLAGYAHAPFCSSRTLGRRYCRLGPLGTGLPSQMAPAVAPFLSGMDPSSRPAASSQSVFSVESPGSATLRPRDSLKPLLRFTWPRGQFTWIEYCHHASR